MNLANTITARQRWLALTAALLGWMFDGLEMGLFPLVGKSALRELLQQGEVDDWYAAINAAFLIGAATGGVLFGWLGDRFGRIFAMTLAVLVYAGSSALCGAAGQAWQLAGLRFLGALGMGGEWALGVALVMELWPNTSRTWLAGWIGAFGNLGYCLLGLIALGLNRVGPEIQAWLRDLGLQGELANYLTRNGNWRLLMFIGAVPALLVFFIRLMVPESQKWRAERNQKKTENWRSTDLVYVLIGALLGLAMVAVWLIKTTEGVLLPLMIRISITAIIVPGMLLLYMQPARNFLQRSQYTKPERQQLQYRLLLAAGLSGVPLLATWGGVMWVYNWVAELAPNNADARPITQVSSSIGAALGCFLAAYLGGWLGRKLSYLLLCITSATALYSFYSYNTQFDMIFILTAGGVGLITASFYGWLPLYLPELFPTAMRAMGQGFGFNFGRVMAAVGSLQTGALLAAFDGDYAKACSVAAAVYLLGLILIAFAPETKGQPLPE